MVTGISHITFTVKDLERSGRFLKNIFAAEEVYCSGDDTFSLSQEKFFLIGGVWICLMQGEGPPARGYKHVAFRISEEDFDDYVLLIEETGAEIKPGRMRVEGEGRSVYFYDYDNNLFELHTGTLEERLKCYQKCMPL